MGKKNLEFFQKHFRNRIEKLHKMAFLIFFSFFERVEKIGYHSNFNLECNTERGFKESLSIALGKRNPFFLHYGWFLQNLVKTSSELICRCT